MYAIISVLFVKRTLATFLNAEFGFLGVVVYTRVQTPLRCGHESKARDLLLVLMTFRPFLTSCDIVGIYLFPFFGPQNVDRNQSRFFGLIERPERAFLLR